MLGRRASPAPTQQRPVDSPYLSILICRHTWVRLLKINRYVSAFGRLPTPLVVCSLKVDRCPEQQSTHSNVILESAASVVHVQIAITRLERKPLVQLIAQHARDLPLQLRAGAESSHIAK